MPDPRSDPPPGADVGSVVRDAKIEELLLVGLDHYFGGHYEQAIHVWTRVLFLDRGHARARAYIERARSAIAERQRESEELLQSGIAAFDRGDAGAARELIDAPVERGGSSDVATALLSRLDRPEPGLPDQPRETPERPRRRTPIVAPDAARPATRRRLVWVAAGSTLLAGFVAIALVSGPLGWVTSTPDAQAARSVAAPAEPLRVPRVAEEALARARTLFARGHLNEALVELEQIGLADALRPDADRLEADIQRVLIETASVATRRP